MRPREKSSSERSRFGVIHEDVVLYEFTLDDGRHYSLHDAGVDSLEFSRSEIRITFTFEGLNVVYSFYGTRAFWGIDFDDVDDPLAGNVHDLSINSQAGVKSETTHIHMQFFCTHFSRSLRLA